MSDDNKKPSDVSDFMSNRFDFGTKPADIELNDWQKKLAALAMGMNAALVQFILEGIIPNAEQIHFMGHLQDFTARIYAGESVKMPSTGQTLQINSKAGNLFYTAAEEALANGRKNIEELKRLSQELREQQAEGKSEQNPNVSTPKTTVH